MQRIRGGHQGPPAHYPVRGAITWKSIVGTNVAADAPGMPGMPGMANPRFAFTMNQAKYDSLPADLKTVIDDNSGLATSAWAGETAFDAVVAPHQKIAQDAGEKIHRLPEAEYARWGAG